MALTKTVTGAVNQIMAVDGTTAVLDAIHALAFTKTGGVGGVWPGDSSNFRTLLGAQAPVIAQAADNLLSDQNASLESAGVGNWAVLNGTLARVAGGYHGSWELQATYTAGGPPWTSYLNIIPITGTGTYTLSMWMKAGNAAAVGKQYAACLYGNDAGISYGATITLSNVWQRSACSIAYTAADNFSRSASLELKSASANGDIVCIDAIQLETGAVATPFCLDSRTASTMTIPTATIGLTAAPLSLAFVVNEPWAGNDGILHTLYDDGSLSIYKTAANALTFEVTDVAAGVKTMAGAVTAVNMAANTNHFIVATLTGGVLTLKLNNTALTTGGGGGNGIPANFNANAFLGTDTAGANFWNGAILGALHGRVLSAGEQTAFASAATWASVIGLPQITVTGLATGNAVRLYDSAGNVHASAVESGGTATLTYTLD